MLCCRPQFNDYGEPFLQCEGCDVVARVGDKRIFSSLTRLTIWRTPLGVGQFVWCFSVGAARPASRPHLYGEQDFAAKTLRHSTFYSPLPTFDSPNLQPSELPFVDLGVPARGACQVGSVTQLRRRTTCASRRRAGRQPRRRTHRPFSRRRRRTARGR